MKVREAISSDCEEILALIKELAIYEKAPDAVIIKEETLLEEGFGKSPLFKAWVAEDKGQLIGFALIYYRFSTWNGRCVYLEDLYVKEAYRRHGVGAMLFEVALQETANINAPKMIWQVLDWNTPAINFYKKYQATLDPEWVNGSLDLPQIEQLLRSKD